MELSNFLYLIYKQKFMMLIAASIAVAVTFYLTRNLPDSYTSKARIATGLVDESQAEILDPKQGDAQESKINLQFANLIQSMQLKKIVDQVSYRLILHDLTDPIPFRKPSKQLGYLNKAARKHAIAVFTQKLHDHEPLYLFDKDQKGLNEVISSMGYDVESIKKKVTIFRLSNSDFIDVEFESDNALLSAFVINTLCAEFITYYTAVVKENKVKAVNFLDELLREKRSAMNAQMQQLKNYKIQNRVLNLNEQAKSLYSQIASFEERKEMAEKDIISYQGAILSIDNKFNPRDRQYLENTLVKVNADIIFTKERIKQLINEYVTSNYDPKIKNRIDSLQTVLTSQINLSTDKYILNPLAAKESLVQQKITLQVQLDLAKNSINTYQNQLNKLNARYDKLVPHEAVIQSFEGEIDIASKEYIEILQKFNQTSMESSFSLRLKQIELAMPGAAVPSKKMLLTIVSGVVVVVLYIVVLFVVFYLDDSIKVAKELANATNIPVFGFLPYLPKSTLHLESIWKSNQQAPVLEQYKELLRSTRFEIERELKDSKLLIISSLIPSEGKTFVSLSLAYAFGMTNKKILIIDGNFDNNSVSNITKPSIFIEDFFNEKITTDAFKTTDNICIAGNRGSDASLFELADEQLIKSKLDELRPLFDVIIVDAPALDDLNKSKEWIVLADKVLAIFKANLTITKPKELQINYLRTLENVFIGWVLNGVVAKKSRLQKLLAKLKSKKKQRRVKHGK